jgi:hypothetical protein
MGKLLNGTLKPASDDAIALGLENYPPDVA